MHPRGAQKLSPEALKRLTASIVAKFVQSHTLPADQVPGLILAVHAALQALTADGGERQRDSSAKLMRDSIKRGYLVCLEDGARLKMLKRHLRAYHGMTPDEYRLKWGLPPHYPMVAPQYAQLRAVYAREGQLWRQRRKGKPRSGHTDRT
jgi:predicted transcriptional regulator